MADLEHELVRGASLASSSASASVAARGFSTSTCFGAQASGRKRMVRLGRGAIISASRRPADVEVQVGRAGFPADRLGAFRIEIVHPRQVGASGRHLQRVVAAEMPDADNANAKRGVSHQGLRPRSLWRRLDVSVSAPSGKR